MRHLLRALPILLSLAAAPADAANLDPAVACKAGAYRLPDGGDLVVTGLDRGRLSVLLPDGERLTLAPQGEDRFAQAAPALPYSLTLRDCGPELQLGDGRVARRADFEETPIQVQAQGVSLAAKLVTPRGRRPGAVVVYVDGSDQQDAIDRTFFQYALPARGVGVLVLDKRGTGGSTGQPTANFDLRAADVNAAVRAVRTRVGPGVKVGLLGLSQGGWVAPLAASREPVDFVAVGFGLAEPVTDEDRNEIVQNLQEAGFGQADIDQALELQAAAAALARSHWTTGWEAWDQVKARYATAPWIKAMGREGVTGIIFSMPTAVAREMASTADEGISFEYEPAPVIRGLRTRQLWMLAGDDHSAPSARTLSILTDIQKTNRELSVVVFPRADHGILERTTEAGVQRVRISAGYVDLIADWAATGRVRTPPGMVVQRAAAAPK